MTTREQFEQWAGEQLNQKSSTPPEGETWEQFAQWMQGSLGQQAAEPEAEPLPNYPEAQDGGAALGLADSASEQEQLKEWFSNQLAFNPFRNGSGWTRII